MLCSVELGYRAYAERLLVPIRFVENLEKAQQWPQADDTPAFVMVEGLWSVRKLNQLPKRAQGLCQNLFWVMVMEA
jgi:hypothetical protein